MLSALAQLPFILHTPAMVIFLKRDEIMSQSCLHPLQRLPITVTMKLKHLSMAFKAFYDLVSAPSLSHLPFALPDTHGRRPLWPSSGP